MSMEHVICNKEADIATIKADVGGIKSDVSDIKHAIMGNGQPGLKTVVAKQGQIVDALVWITGACITSILAIAVSLLVAYIKTGAKI